MIQMVSNNKVLLMSLFKVYGRYTANDSSYCYERSSGTIKGYVNGGKKYLQAVWLIFYNATYR